MTSAIGTAADAAFEFALSAPGNVPSDQEAGLQPSEMTAQSGLLKEWTPFLAKKVQMYGEVKYMPDSWDTLSADATYAHGTDEREAKIYTAIVGNDFSNTLYGGDDHTINLAKQFEYSHNTELYGMGGNDKLYGGRLGDVLSGGTGSDKIWGNGGSDNISGGYGSDTVFAGDGNDVVYAGRDADTVYAGNGKDTVFGGTGSDTLNGGNGSDTIFGGRGADKISGGADQDAIDGGAGNDVISGGAGNDTLRGGADHDALTGGDGADLMEGGAGNDVLNGGAGADHMDGGAGNDFMMSGSMINHTGVEYMYGGEGDDTFVIGDGNAEYTSDYMIDISAAFPEEKGGWTGILDAVGNGIGAYEPLKPVGGALKAIAGAFDFFYEHTAPDPQTVFDIPADWGTVGEVEVMDFNPFHEQVLIPLNDVLENGKLDTDVDIIFPDQSAGESFAFKVVDNRANQNAEIAVVQWDPDMIDELPDYMTVNNLGETLSPEKYDAIRESLKASTLYYNGDSMHVGGAERSGDFDGDMAGTGNAYFGVGAFGGYEIYDNVTENDNWIGTAFGDTIGAFVPENIDSTSVFNAYAAKGSTLYGLDGNDLLFGGAGDDKIYGGDGDGDFVAYYDAQSVIVDMESDGTTDGVDYFNSYATYKAESGSKMKYDEDANFEIENVIGSNGDDTITGNANANIIDGTGGNDTLDGGAGFDELWGGEGNDTFIFADGDHQYFSNTKLGAEIDRVMDFEVGEDTIRIDISSFDQTKVDSVDAFSVAQVDGDSFVNYAFQAQNGQTNYHTVAVVEDTLLNISDITFYDDALLA